MPDCNSGPGLDIEYTAARQSSVAAIELSSHDKVAALIEVECSISMTSKVVFPCTIPSNTDRHPVCHHLSHSRAEEQTVASIC